VRGSEVSSKARAAENTWGCAQTSKGLGGSGACVRRRGGGDVSSHILRGVTPGTPRLYGVSPIRIDDDDGGGGG
jgi:hypothetical protein